MSTATPTAPPVIAPPAVGEKTVDLIRRRVGDPPYVGRHRRRRPTPVNVPVSALLTTENAK